LRLPFRSKRARLGLAAVVVLALVGAGLGAYFYEKNRTGSIYHPHARFVAEPAPKPAPSIDRFEWPFYGYGKDHTRFFPASARLHPPFRLMWAHDFGTLLEFPPVMRGDHIFQLGDNAIINAIDKHNGHTFWFKKLGSLSASAPAVVDHTVYVTVLAGSRGGRIVALDYAHGDIRWSRDLASRTESSPTVDGGRVYFGSENGTVYAMNAKTGDVIWTYHASGAVKASPTLKNGILYFGDYSGEMQAISASDGHRIWRSGSEGALVGSGTFYSTPAAAYGRVFLGNTDGRVYAYDADNGHLDWAVQTGNYVYSSPAVTNAPGLGPTVYIGSYDGSFRALDARTGHVDWTYSSGGKISGSPTIIGRTVYFADLGKRRTYGLGISTGRLSFTWFSGSFDPAISDGRNLYLTGYSGLYGLSPR
jgi:outer membrane protein assembly factor BamB